MKALKTKPPKFIPHAASTALTLSPSSTPQVDPKVLARSTNVSAQVALLKVTDERTAQIANTLLLDLKEVEKEVSAQRDFVIKPLKQHIAQLETLFRPARDALEKADLVLRRKVLDYRAELSRVAQEEQERLLQEAEDAQAKALEASEKKGKKGQGVAAQLASQAQALAIQAQEVAAPARVMTTENGQVATRKVWKFEIEDMGAVPMEYFTLDESKLRRAVQSGARQIPGVRIFAEETLSVGGR